MVGFRTGKIVVDDIGLHLKVLIFWCLGLSGWNHWKSGYWYYYNSIFLLNFENAEKHYDCRVYD